MAFFKFKKPTIQQVDTWLSGLKRWASHDGQDYIEDLWNIPPATWLEEMEADDDYGSAQEAFQEDQPFYEQIGFEGGLSDEPKVVHYDEQLVGYMAALRLAATLLYEIWEDGFKESKALIGEGKLLPPGTGYPYLRINNTWYGPPEMDLRFVDGEFEGWRHEWPLSPNDNKYYDYGKGLQDCVRYTLRYLRDQAPYLYMLRMRCLEKSGPHQFCLEAGGDQSVFSLIPSVELQSIQHSLKPGHESLREVRVDFRVFVYCQTCEGDELSWKDTRRSYPASMFFLCRAEEEYFRPIWSRCLLYRYWAYAWTAPYLKSQQTQNPDLWDGGAREDKQSRFANYYALRWELCGHCEDDVGGTSVGAVNVDCDAPQFQEQSEAAEYAFGILEKLWKTCSWSISDPAPDRAYTISNGIKVDTKSPLEMRIVRLKKNGQGDWVYDISVMFTVQASCPNAAKCVKSYREIVQTYLGYPNPFGKKHDALSINDFAKGHKLFP